MFFNVRMIVCLHLVTLYFCWLCAFETGRRFKYSVSDWRKCDTSNDEFRTFRNIPIQDCLLECRIRKRCKAVKFLTIGRECGLMETASFKMARKNNTRPCVFIRMADVEDIISIPSICQNCSFDEACDLQEERCEIRETCTRNWNRTGQSCYFFSYKWLTFDMANIYCQHRRAHVIHIETEKENDKIIKLRKGIHFRMFWRWSWIGITDIKGEGIWKYTQTNVIANFSRWYTGEPSGGVSENCAVFRTYYGAKWWDVPCSWRAGVICEKRW